MDSEYDEISLDGDSEYEDVNCNDTSVEAVCLDTVKSAGNQTTTGDDHLTDNFSPSTFAREQMRKEIDPFDRVVSQFQLFFDMKRFQDEKAELDSEGQGTANEPTKSYRVNALGQEELDENTSESSTGEVRH